MSGLSQEGHDAECSIWGVCVLACLVDLAPCSSHDDAASGPTPEELRNPHHACRLRGGRELIGARPECGELNMIERSITNFPLTERGGRPKRAIIMQKSLEREPVLAFLM